MSNLSKEFYLGAAFSFLLTSLLFSIIIAEGFVSKESLKLRQFYRNGKMYRSCVE